MKTLTSNPADHFDNWFDTVNKLRALSDKARADIKVANRADEDVADQTFQYDHGLSDITLVRRAIKEAKRLRAYAQKSIDDAQEVREAMETMMQAVAS